MKETRVSDRASRKQEYAKNSEVFWNKIHSRDYTDHISADNWLDSFLLMIDKCETPILDLGCGSGNDTLYFTKMGKKVIACDQSENAILQIRKNFSQNVEARCFNMLDGFPFPDKSFDIVCADLCLHYFTEADSKKILKNIKKLLTEEGHVLVRVNSMKDVNHGAGQGIEIEHHLFETKEGMLKRFFDEEDLPIFFEGFEILFCEEQKMNRYDAEKITYILCLKLFKVDDTVEW